MPDKDMILVNGCGNVTEDAECPTKSMACGCRTCSGTCSEILPVSLID